MANLQKITPCLWFDGQEFQALKGGPHFKFNEAISLVSARAAIRRSPAAS